MQNNIKEPVKCNDKCPYCGSDKRMVKEYVEEQRSEGNIGSKAFPDGAGSLNLAFVDPTLPRYQLGRPVPAPAMQVKFDICGECKKLYPVEITYQPQMTIVSMTPAPRMKGG
ncbi:MAG: hypothetical protein PHI12_06515 [Dehalococcoidales bacterium]|nr:hypothetical protein [Dehalococcoidales bacterium]